MRDRRDEARERARKRAQNEKFGGGSKTISLPSGFKEAEIKKPGRRDLSVLPFTVTGQDVMEDPPLREGEIWYRRLYRRHRDVGAKNNAENCPRSIGKRCPLCEEKAEYLDRGEKEKAKALNSSLRMIMLLEPESEGGPIEVLDISYEGLGKKLKSEISDSSDPDDCLFYMAEDGRVLSVRFEEEDIGYKNPFIFADRIDFRKRKNLTESLLKRVVDPVKFLNFLSYEDLQKKFLGLEDEADRPKEREPESEERETERSSRRSKPPEEQEQEIERSSRRSKPPEETVEAPRESSSEAQDLDNMNFDELMSFAKKQSIDLGLTERKLRKMDLDDVRDLIERGGKDDGKNPEKKEESNGNGTECPHGHKFGEDTDKKEECRKCETSTWEKCQDRKDEIQKGRRTR